VPVWMFSFRFSERYVTVLNFLLIGTIVYFLAQSVSTAIKLHLAGVDVSSAPELVSHTSRRHSQPGLQARPYYNAIIERDIFSRAPVAAPPPVEDATIQLTLVGTSHLSGGKPFIVVENPDGDQSLYRLGETIPNVGKVLSISRSRAVVLHNGHQVALKIPNDIPQQERMDLPRRPFMGDPMYRRRMHQRAPFGPYSAPGVRRLSPNRYVIGRTTVDRNLANMPLLFTQIRAIPNLEDGASNGFRLSEIQPGSIFEQIGLHDGDVITGAQGETVNDPMRAMALLNSLRNSQSINLSVIRNGSPVQLHYMIR
jgi:type II secretion system protein C